MPKSLSSALGRCSVILCSVSLALGCAGGGGDGAPAAGSGGSSPSGGATGGSRGGSGGTGGSASAGSGAAGSSGPAQGGAGGASAGAGAGAGGNPGGAGAGMEPMGGSDAPMMPPSSEPAMPRAFPAHTQYAEGVLKPGGGQEALDQAAARFYDAWKARFLKAGCGGWYVETGQVWGADGAMTISEAQGYAMIATALMHGHDPMAKQIFDGLHTFAKKFESVNKTGLMAWVIMDGCKYSTAVTGNLVPDSAADGDLDMAYGYLLAHRQWGSTGEINYLGEAQKLIAAIKKHEINPETKLVMLGDWADVKAPYYPMRYTTGFAGPYGSNTRTHADYYWGTRSSDFMLGHFRAFGPASGDSEWSGVILDKHYALIAHIQSKFSSATGLMPDFIENTNAEATPAQPNYLEWVNDDKYAYNACRFPWRLGSDLVLSGDARARTALSKIAGWAKGVVNGSPDNFKAGYRLNGSLSEGANYTDLAFQAPIGVAAMASGDQAFVDTMWRFLSGKAISSYYGDSINLLVLFVMSGNWWSPY